MVVLICITIPMVFALIALFIGVAQMQYARSEMRLAADAAARAATEAVLRTGDQNAAYQHASGIAANHRVMGRAIQLQRENVIFGQSRSVPNGEWKFTANAEPFNAARVDIIKHKDARSGAVQTLFPSFGPNFFETAQTATAAQIDHDIMLVIEAGGSMHAPNRWEYVMAAMEELVALAPQVPNNVRIGMVECHNEPVVRLEPSNGADDLLSVLQQLHEQAANTKLRQSRNLGGGLEAASNVLQGAKYGTISDQTIIFLGNGHHVKGTHPSDAARLAALRGQVIYAITFGHNQDKKGDMERAAGITGGEYFHVTEMSWLREILTDLLTNQSIVLIR